MSRRCFALALLACAMVATGCRSFVFAPAPDGDDCTTVWLIEEGVHTGLALPHPEEGLVEYGYGDWSWYAEGNVGILEAFPAMFWETGGTVGRRSLAEPDVDIEADPAAWYRRRRFEVRMSPLLVSRQRAQQLQQRLDGMIDGVSDDDRRFNGTMEFAKVDRGFWLFCNCNDAVADWLRELGCQVTPALARFGLQVAGPRATDIVIRNVDE